MSANNSKLTVSSLDFDSIKTNLVNYLKSQNTFSNFNFAGGALDQLLNVLAYNTHYLSFYLNLVANEMFIDTAVVRQNIVSHAKVLGYVPRSATAPLAIVNVTITKTNTDPTTSLTMPRFTAFSSELLNGVSYNFITTDTQTVSNSNNTFTFTGVTIREGQPVSKTFVVNSLTNPTQTFDLGDPNIDTSTLQVVVQTSATQLAQNTFALASDATQVSANSNVYYLNQGQNGSYQIYFGDGVLGVKLIDGNLITVSYINTSGAAGNSLQNFRLQTALLSGSTSNVTSFGPSSAGSPPESGDSVRFSAPKSYLSQNRTVTVNDYINLINKNYPFFQAVTVWGGNDNVPPVYGKVFISAKPLNGFVITAAQKQFVIQNILKPIGVLTVIPEFIDADYNFLNYRVNVSYNPKLTSSTAAQITSIVANAVAAWSNTNLNQFNNNFKLSRLTRAIDDSEPSITTSDVELFLEKRFDPIIGIPTTYTLTYGTPLSVGLGPQRLYSSPSFTMIDGTGISRQCYIEETPQSSTGISSVSITNPGSKYTTAPTLTITGDGTGANAYATIVNGQIQSVTIDAAGANYTTATVTITGGGGTGAVLQALIQGSTGALRTYYFANNNVKTILSANTGTIDYLNGIVVLTNFAPVNVANPSQTLSIHVPPAKDTFGSNFNRILTYDTTDSSALSVTINIDTSS